MSTRLLVLLVFDSDFCFFNNNYCYHHYQVNIQTKLCNVSTSALKAIIFSLALLCLSSAAVLRFEELAQLLQQRQQVSWTLVANSLKVVRNVVSYTPPPTPLEQKQTCATYMPTTAASEVLKKEHAAVTWKKIACLEALAPKTSMVRNTH